MTVKINNKGESVVVATLVSNVIYVYTIRSNLSEALYITMSCTFIAWKVEDQSSSPTY